MSFNSIPEFSFPLINNRDPDTIKALKNALTTHGFFTITDHGIDDDLLSASYSMSKKFFELEEATKNTYAHPEIGGARGYTPFGKETALGETTPDMKEFWHHGPITELISLSLAKLNYILINYWPQNKLMYHPANNGSYPITAVDSVPFKYY